ncbi:helix-turn-helix transcriptional regulator [Aestuariicella hydrocarbonica]|uniref:Helix-turn-helix transcriptional regulator n=1 Tax=Pseudomaricurvus hydrocarbonicus TaxID=1470433 RepID=A0A9E5JUE9_9GAMM|nr:helix-turn-helix transcriptional regulator [Aestuariicella hydrocarbonica]NHO65509.1 helix-turn-helix transcriptional regulator [Aestuariicella hydrocarbonica]
MSVQVIMKDGRPEWAVLPYTEYEALLARVEALESGAPAPASTEIRAEDSRNLRKTMMEQLQNVASVSQAGSFQGEKAAKLRLSKGLDEAHIAREIGISPVYLKQIESGEREPSEPILRNIARALGVDVNELSGE